MYRYRCPHRGAIRAGFDFQLPTHLFQPFLHALDAHPAGEGKAFVSSLTVPWNASSVVAYFQQDSPRIAVQPNSRAEAAGMAMNVHQALLHHSEQGHLFLLGQPSEARCYLQVNLDARALRKTGRVMSNRIL